MATVKFSDWVSGELPPLPSNQTIAGDGLVVIRGGLPYEWDPVTRKAYAQMSGNAAVTTINTIGVWESIAGTLVASGSDQGFTLASNIWTVTAEDSLDPRQMEVGMGVMKVGSGDDTYEVGIFQNGTLEGVAIPVNAHMTKLGNLFVKAPLILDTGDVIEVKIRNLEDTANVVITSMFFGTS
jgi:hypothetical protein